MKRSIDRREMLRMCGMAGVGALWLSTRRAPADSEATGITRRTWMIDSVNREALISVPAAVRTVATPVVFAFHGHGGTMAHAARSFGIHALWPEAIVVYPQGLDTPGQLTDPTGTRPGWQRTPGDQNDRDLKLFDAVLASIQREYKIDDRRIYSMGHSNGGAFTYLLWATRGDKLAAVAPSAAVAGRFAADLKPKPVLHVAGEKDPLVRFAWQQAMIQRLRTLNQCTDGKPWAEGCTLYPSRVGAPLVTFIHPGGHVFPAEAPGHIVRFFRERSSK